MRKNKKKNKKIHKTKDEGHAQFIVTSNHDGLHDKSGITPKQHADLFGNVYVEKCRKCKQRFYRKTVVPILFRKCENCGGKLKRTKCNMGESVPKQPRKIAEKHAQFCKRRKKNQPLFFCIHTQASTHTHTHTQHTQHTQREADLSLVLGSSMTVYPFCEMPPLAKKMVIVTRQNTKFDKQAGNLYLILL